MRNSIQPDKLDKIVMHFPELSIAWLITGEGNMLRETEQLLGPIEREKIVEIGSEAFKDRLLEMFKNGEIYTSVIIREKDEIIAKLQNTIVRLEIEIERLRAIIDKRHNYDTDNTYHIMKSKPIRPAINDIQRRFFQAIDILIGSDKIASLQAFCNDYGLHRPKYSNIRSFVYDHSKKWTGYKLIDIDALAYIVSDYGISSDWLLTGKGGMFRK